MEEAEELCNRILIINKGKAVAEGSPGDLIETHIGSEVIEFDVDPVDLEKYVGRFEKKFTYQIMRNRLKLFLRREQSAREAIADVVSTNVVIRRASLNDVFLKISGYELSE
jgi:lipooligosaccharide transport system ATP-binding protein